MIQGCPLNNNYMCQSQNWLNIQMKMPIIMMSVTQNSNCSADWRLVSYLSISSGFIHLPNWRWYTYPCSFNSFLSLFVVATNKISLTTTLSPTHYVLTTLDTHASSAHNALRASSIYWNDYVPTYGIVHGQPHNQLCYVGQVWFSSCMRHHPLQNKTPIETYNS